MKLNLKCLKLLVFYSTINTDMKKNLRQLKITPDRITMRDDNINRYFHDVERQPMLTMEEEFQVGLKAQAGDAKAIHKLVNANLRFVVSVAKQYSGNSQPLSEMIAQGNIGLVHAAGTFDPTRGFKFISYAVWHIRKEILLYLNQNMRVVKIPQNIITDLAAIRRVESSFIQREGRLPTPLEIEEALEGTTREIKADKVQQILETDARSTPLEDNSNDDDAYSPINWLNSGDSTSTMVEDKERLEMAHVILNALPPMQKFVISMRLGLTDGHTYSFSEIASKLERTPECARQIFNKGIKVAQSKIMRSRRNREEFALFD
jgi:RNA polymerase primary sigma factor